MRQESVRRHQLAVACLMVIATCPLMARAQVQAAPPLDPWEVEIHYENDTRVRGKDNTGKTVGLSKFRNTLQMEANKKLEGGWAFRSIVRGSFDGVYRMNKGQYGATAGSSDASDVQLQNTISSSAGIVSTVPYGQGIGATSPGMTGAPVGVNGALGALGVPSPSSAFVNGGAGGTPPASYGSGAGLRVLGDRWHGADGGVAFAVPVRPCDVDARGCADFGGYGNLKQSELEAPEFNDRLDFLREAFVTNSFNLDDNRQLFLKLGRQQVVWGRTDLFRVLDVINPVDFSRNNIYDELQDIRIPMWIAQAEYRMGASDTMQDRNLQVVWNFDKFRANNLGQCGSPNVIIDAGCFFRGMKNLWDNGGTVANFAHFNTGAAGVLGVPPDMFLATNFGAGQIGIRNVNLPKWSLENTQLGMKYEGVSKDGLSFSLNALTYRSQMPSLHAFNSAQNPFTGAVQPSGHLIAFDVYFPRVNLLGGSMDLQWESAGASVRLEGALTSGEEFVNTLKPELYSKNKVFRSVVGVDRPTFIPFINPNRTTLISAQLFFQHIVGHELEQGSVGAVGMPDWKDNAIATLLIRASLANDRVSPQILGAYDVRARGLVISPSVDWSVTDDIKFTVGGNFKAIDDKRHWGFDDCRSCNPYAPFTQYDGQGTSSGSAGQSGLEPLGRFRAGPIASAWKENELYMTVRYKF